MEMLAVVTLLLSVANSTLLVDPSMAALSETEKAEILADFAAARAYMLFHLRLKFGHWGQLPWILLGLAHPDVEKARACMRRALQLYEASSKQNLHWWVLLLLVPGSTGHAQVVDFVNGRPLQSLPFLQRVAAMFFFVMVSERWIEGRHTRSSRVWKIANHSGARFLAFSLISKPLRKYLRAFPAKIHDFATVCQRVRNAQEGCEVLGLSHHPRVLALLEQAGGRRRRRFEHRHRGEHIRILFHIDAFTLHALLPDEDEDLTPLAPPQRPPPALSDEAARPSAETSFLQRMEEKFIEDQQHPAHGQSQQASEIVDIPWHFMPDSPEPQNNNNKNKNNNNNNNKKQQQQQQQQQRRQRQQQQQQQQQ